MGTGSWRLENLPSVAGVVDGVDVATTLEQMLACWIAERMDGEKPPDTSVPSPTYKISGGIIHVISNIPWMGKKKTRYKP